MDREDAEEYTQALGQVVAGGWRQAALGERLGVPQALGLTTREWVSERLGGYLKLSIQERRQAVAELDEEGMTQRQIADVLGAGKGTVHDDLARNRAEEDGKPAETQPQAEPRARNRAEEEPPTKVAPPDLETICPVCHGTGRVRVTDLEGSVA